MRRAALAALALASCAPGPPQAAEEAGPAFDPIAFFTGASHGEATLAQIFKGERAVRVHSFGRRGNNGTLTLVQRIAIEREKPRARQWTMRPLGNGRYTGQLTDASGPVDIRTIGRAVRVRYPMKGGLQVEQWLVAKPGGRVLHNRLSVTKWGVEVARLEERISKV